MAAFDPRKHIPKLVRLEDAAFRGDYYRTNFTAGFILERLIFDEGPVLLDVLYADIEKANKSGVPGGPAGEQWRPPTNPDYPDTLRPMATRYMPKGPALERLVRVLEYCNLVKLSTKEGGTIELSDMGKKVARKVNRTEAKMRETGTQTAVQLYLTPDHRDKDEAGPLTVVSQTASSFGVSQALAMTFKHYSDLATRPVNGKVIDRDSLAPDRLEKYDKAIQEGLVRPDILVDIINGTKKFDKNLPLRRVQLRKPTYRQFLWSVFSDHRTVLLTIVGQNEEALRIITSGLAIDVASTPTEFKIKETRENLRQVQMVADMVLRGGPEAIWVGKPLDARDVHGEITGFNVSKRAGFTDDLVTASSIAWEMYSDMKFTMSDLENSRKVLEAQNAKLISRDRTNATDESLDLTPEKKKAAQTYVVNTADQLLRDIGMEEVPIRVRDINDSAGVPFRVTCMEPSCKSQAIGGSGHCARHGGTYLSQEETESLVRAVQQKIFGASDRSVEVMIELMLGSSNDAIRLRAAEQLLNRGGFSESRDISVTLATSESKADKSASAHSVVRERLFALTGVHNATNGGQKELETIDAEIVEPQDEPDKEVDRIGPEIQPAPIPGT